MEEQLPQFPCQCCKLNLLYNPDRQVCFNCWDACVNSKCRRKSKRFKKFKLANGKIVLPSSFACSDLIYICPDCPLTYTDYHNCKAHIQKYHMDMAEIARDNLMTGAWNHEVLGCNPRYCSC